MSGVLVLVGTPIGNRGDLSPRAREAIASADLLLCEDTRSPPRLLGEGPLPTRMSCFVGNERERVPVMLEALAEGRRVVFVSEAGMPVWSDPGRGLVDAAWAAGVAVDVIPGPSAATTALAASGFAAEHARFVGFVPRSGADRETVLDSIGEARGASIVFEAGNRVVRLLRDLSARVGSRAVFVGRELTKRHQELARDSVAALLERYDAGGETRGEFTLVVAGGPGPAPTDEFAAPRAVLDALTDPDAKPRARAKRIAALTGLDANDVYDRLSAARDGRTG